MVTNSFVLGLHTVLQLEILMHEHAYICGIAAELTGSVWSAVAP